MLAAMLGMAAAFAGTERAAAQPLDDHAFIHWVADEAPVNASSAPDPDYIAELQALEETHARRLIGADVHFSADGTIEHVYRTIYDYADTTGIEFEGNASVFVDSFSEELWIERAEVTTADGRVIAVDPMTVQVLLEDSGGVFSDNH
ncbi:MAG: hypothetical protein R3305_07710, partial [Gammaproteobacteria bacterium]|nr:hypothetical protein [Gammaproteobacteria bacterium]